MLTAQSLCAPSLRRLVHSLTCGSSMNVARPSPALVLQATTLGLEGLGTRLRGSHMSPVGVKLFDTLDPLQIMGQLEKQGKGNRKGNGKQEGERERVTEDYIYFPLARVMGGQAVDSDLSSVVKLSTTEHPRLAQ